MRKSRLLGGGTCVYHVLSRIVDRRFVLGDEERSHFISTIRKLEMFGGVRVLTYCVMSNHFHILPEVQDMEAVAEVGSPTTSWSPVPGRSTGVPLAKVHRLELTEVLRCRVRYFYDGLVFETAGWAEGTSEKMRERFADSRKTCARRMR